MLATTMTKWADDDDDEVRRDDDEEFFTATRGRELSPSSRSSTDRPQRRPQSAAQKLRLGAQFHRENVTMPEMTSNAAVITSSLDLNSTDWNWKSTSCSLYPLDLRANN